MRLGVLDIGSNTGHLLVVDAHRGAAPLPAYSHKEPLQLAEHILEQKKGHFDPDKFDDRYEDALHALIKAKKAGKAPPALSEPRPSNVINLMDALRRSVGEKKEGHGRRTAKSPGRRTPGTKKTAKHKRLKKAS